MDDAHVGGLTDVHYSELTHHATATIEVVSVCEKAEGPTLRRNSRDKGRGGWLGDIVSAHTEIFYDEEMAVLQSHPEIRIRRNVAQIVQLLSGDGLAEAENQHGQE